MLKIIHLTDLHIENVDSILFGQKTFDNLCLIKEEIKSIANIDCIIITGDVTHSGKYTSYLLVDDVLNELSVPKYWLPGNHDLNEVMFQVAKKVKFSSEKSFSINDSKFILLNSTVRDEDNLSRNKARGILFDYELDFLKMELENGNFNNYIVALHHPPIESGYWFDRRILQNRDEFNSIIKEHPKARLVLYGHSHYANYKLHNGLTYISSPNGSYHYDPHGNIFSLLEKKPGFGIITIDENYNINYEFR